VERVADRLAQAPRDVEAAVRSAAVDYREVLAAARLSDPVPARSRPSIAAPGRAGSSRSPWRRSPSWVSSPTPSRRSGSMPSGGAPCRP
jgi:hypothetical protein